MALVQRRQFQVPAAIAALMANPDARRAIMNMAREGGNQLGNYARRLYNRDQTHNEEEEQMEPDSTNEAETIIDNPSLRGYDGSDTAGGHRGKLVGNTTTHLGYEKHYHERQMCHSKKLKLQMYTWGMSVYGPRHKNNGEMFTLYSFGTTGATGKATPGIVCLPSPNVYGDNINYNAITPFGPKQTNYDFSENVYSNAINFILSDFIDNKLMNDSGSKGIFLQYRKFRLKSFTVEITPVSHAQNIMHYCPNVLHSARNFNGWQDALSAAEKLEFQKLIPARYDDKVDPGYFFYRDQYTSYSDVNNNIPILPPDSLPNASPAKFKREQYAIKNLDSNLTFVKSGETFSFTRELNPTGGYYFSRESLLANYKTNIANIVNLLEGQITTGTSAINKLMEGFNLLFVPGKTKITMYGEIKLGPSGNGYVLIPELMTQLQIKTSGIWEAFDYNYSDNNPITYVDPLEKAVFDFNVERSVEIAQLNRS